jgi:hypothetical protein
MLLSLEESVQQERDDQIAVLKRARRYSNASSSDRRDEGRNEKMVDTVEGHELVSAVEARLINIRLLV